MRYYETKIRGAYIVEPEPYEDEYGFFVRTWCEHEFKRKAIDLNLKQCNVFYNHKYGTLRGLHLQLPPFTEAKLVCCNRGAIYDVILDLRAGSPTYLQWFGIELSDENYTSLYVPRGLAHGFLTLYDETEVFYQMSEYYAPEYTIGVRWNDPCFNIHWPSEVRVISVKDQTLPDYDPARFIGIDYEDSLKKSSNTYT